jgi:hypothetical protein
MVFKMMRLTTTPQPREEKRTVNRRNRDFSPVWPSFRSLAHSPCAAVEPFARTICAAAAAQRADLAAASASAGSLWRARLLSTLQRPE